MIELDEFTKQKLVRDIEVVYEKEISLLMAFATHHDREANYTKQYWIEMRISNYDEFNMYLNYAKEWYSKSTQPIRRRNALLGWLCRLFKKRESD